jgi:hypothetical protein
VNLIPATSEGSSTPDPLSLTIRDKFAQERPTTSRHTTILAHRDSSPIPKIAPISQVFPRKQFAVAEVNSLPVDFPGLQAEFQEFRKLVATQSERQEAHIRALEADVRHMEQRLGQRQAGNRDARWGNGTRDATTISRDVAAVRNELTSIVEEECKARLRESTEMRLTLEYLTQQITSANASIKFAIEPEHNSEELHSKTVLHADVARSAQRLEELSARFEDVSDEIRVERERRCGTNAEMHAHVARELADIRATFEKSLSEEVQIRNHDAQEFRAILGSVWKELERKQVDRRREHDSFDSTDLGLPCDMDILYSMVREALGDTVRLSQEIK